MNCPGKSCAGGKLQKRINRIGLQRGKNVTYTVSPSCLSWSLQSYFQLCDPPVLVQWGSKYSQHPKSGPWSVFRFNFMPVLGIWKPDHLKSKQKCPDFELSKLDRFIIKKIFLWLFVIKWSRLGDHSKSGHNLSGFQMVKKQYGWHNLAAILFLPFEIWTKKSPDYEWSGLA